MSGASGAPLRLFDERGLAPTLDDVAQAAGVGPATRRLISGC